MTLSRYKIPFETFISVYFHSVYNMLVLVFYFYVFYALNDSVCLESKSCFQSMQQIIQCYYVSFLIIIIILGNVILCGSSNVGLVLMNFFSERYHYFDNILIKSLIMGLTLDQQVDVVYCTDSVVL